MPGGVCMAVSVVVWLTSHLLVYELLPSGILLKTTRATWLAANHPRENSGLHSQPLS